MLDQEYLASSFLPTTNELWEQPEEDWSDPCVERVGVTGDGQRPTIHTVNALCGAGKTTLARQCAIDQASCGEKVLFVLPTKELIDEVFKEVKRVQSGGGTRYFSIRRIYQTIDGDALVTGEIVKHLKAACDGIGEILFITQAAFLRLPYIYRPESLLH